MLAAVALVSVLLTQLASRDSGEPAAAVPLSAMAPGSPPDISTMSPRARASALYDRIMRLHEEQKADSVAFFAPMALASFAAIPDIDADGRYDMARIAMIGGSMDVARAQADTMLRRDSTHLLALLLNADLARANSDREAVARFESRLVAAAPRERAKNLPEYDAHGREIDRALERLNSGAARK